MSQTKMTDILVSTPSFVSTLTYSTKKQKSSSSFAIVEIEVHPLAGDLDVHAVHAEAFFDILVQDGTNQDKTIKELSYEVIIALANQRFISEFLEHIDLDTIEKLCQSGYTEAQIALIDYAGQVKLSEKNSLSVVLNNLQRLERELFVWIPFIGTEKHKELHKKHIISHKEQNKYLPYFMRILHKRA